MAIPVEAAGIGQGLDIIIECLAGERHPIGGPPGEHPIASCSDFDGQRLIKRELALEKAHAIIIEATHQKNIDVAARGSIDSYQTA